jgi:hypothetical protein
MQYTTVSRWSRYWFADGGRLAAAIVRIAIALAVLWSLGRIANKVSTEDIAEAQALYRPVGIWMLLGHSPPPPGLVAALWVVAGLATFAMLIGVFSRTSTAISFFSSVSLAALSFAQTKTWSHQYNVVFLAQLAFLGARGGDALSIDALIRSLRGRPARDEAFGYQWSLRLVQLAVALMFAGAAFHKIMHGHFTLRWALSDNLRHHLLVRYDLAGLSRPELVDWIIDDVWRYRTVAVLNLVSQLMPLVACVFIRRPLVRALCGAFFVLETIALGEVVSLWNPHWLPLFAVFVDWDALVGRLLFRPVPTRFPEPGWKPPRAAWWFVLGFVVYDAVTALVPALDQKLNTYPFSGFPMFATIRAREPFDEHLPYSLPGAHFEVFADQPIDPGVQRWFDHVHRGMETIRDPAQLQARLDALLAHARERYPDQGIRGVRLWLTIFEAPAYPAPAHFEPHPIAIIGELRDGAFRTVLGHLDGDRVVPATRDVQLDPGRLEYFRDDAPEPIAMTDDRVGAGDPIYAVALASDGTPWLVASRAEWHWQ